jgi:AraC-like DNA-binding protein
MRCLQTGQFYGITNQTVNLTGLTMTDTEYTGPSVDWHYHENAYFTFLLQGQVLEGNKKEVYHCTAGDLLFHHWQDAHYNRKPDVFTRGFHVEIHPHWFQQYELTGLVEGSIRFKHPQASLLMYRIVKETKQQPTSANATIDQLLIQLLSITKDNKEKLTGSKPRWVTRLETLLHDHPDSHLWTLTELAREADIHPVHLSRSFQHYFHHSFSDYMQLIKLQKALSLLPHRQQSLTSIAAACGFADQSHFIRHFKTSQKTTPLQYRKLL